MRLLNAEVGIGEGIVWSDGGGVVVGDRIEEW